MPKNVAEVDLEVYLTKPPTDLQYRFAEWIRDQVGYDPTKAKTKEDAFNEGVRLGTALRMIFQASPENQQVLEDRRAERENGSEPAPVKPKAAPAPAKKAATGKKRAAVVEEPEEEPARPAKKAAAKKATGTKRRPAPPSADEDEVAPF